MVPVDEADYVNWRNEYLNDAEEAIFILFINQFYMSLKISRLLIKQKEMAQKIALEQIAEKEEK